MSCEYQHSDEFWIAGSWSATPTQLDFAVWPGTAPLASGAYRITAIGSATQMTLASSPAAVNKTGGIARTIRTAVGASDCRPGTASSVLTAGLGLTLGVGS